MASLLALGREFPLNNHLCCDARMVCTDLPQGVFTLHTLVTSQSIHDCMLESVTHVQAAGDVRRRNHDAVGVAFTGWGEVTFLFPVFIQGLLDFVRLVSSIHCASFWLKLFN